MTARQGTPSFSRERDLVRFVERYLHNRSFRRLSQEVPFFEYRMDMYAFSRSQNLTVAIELKLKKWPRAVKQALLYQLCSDLVYIALPSTGVASVNLSLLSKYGVGLLSVTPNGCRQILASQRSPVLRPYYRNKYLALLSED